MSTLQQLVNYSIDHYQVWLTYLYGATWITLVVQYVKKRFKLDDRLTVWKVEAKKFVALLLGVVAAATALADVVISNTDNTFLQLLPQAAAIWPWLVAASLFIHRFVVSGTWKKVSTFLKEVTDYKASKVVPVQPLAPTPSQPPVNFE
jgi:hypothetical protein